jgi:hypothetical protein
MRQTLACHELPREQRKMAFPQLMDFRCHRCRPKHQASPARNVSMQGQRPGRKIACRSRPTLIRSRYRSSWFRPCSKVHGSRKPCARGTVSIDEARFYGIHTVRESAQIRGFGCNRTRGNASLPGTQSSRVGSLAADDPFGRRTVEPVLPFTRAVTGQLHRAFRRVCLLSALRGISSPRVRALRSCGIGT